MRSLLVLFALAACLPQVGPPVLDASMNGGGAGGGGGDPGCPGFAGCAVFVAGTDIDFPGGGESYSPKCLRVTAGQVVTFTGGNFTNHPLHQACGPVQVLEQTTGSRAQFTLTVPGTYGFYCGEHGSSTGSGMSGAIEVVP